jgi:glyoxylase-like metal-dependent hydrolase (beta-lactamase superfamily II)
MRELQKGLWHWEAPHPEWDPSDGGPDGWGPEVSCYAIDDGERLLLFDPLALPAGLEDRACSGETAVVLTNVCHERDARDLAERLGAQVFVPPSKRPGRLEGQSYAAGDRLPVGVEARPGNESPFDYVLWVESCQTIVLGDSLIDNGTGLTLFDRWIPEGQTREQVLERLRPLLELPVEIVLPTHGAPTDRAALERALTDVDAARTPAPKSTRNSSRLTARTER